jgi:hypothetical protein
MAEGKTATRRRGSGGSKGSGRAKGSGRSKGSGATGGRRRSRALTTGTGQSRSVASKPKGGRQSRNRSNASKRDGETAAAKVEAKAPAAVETRAATGGKPMGRAPSEEPDVSLDVSNLHVGKLNIDVDRLQAHLALRAQVANLVNLVAGVHVGVDRVNIDIEDVDASVLLKVRLQNTYNILDRTLTTVDENPEVLQGVLEAADTAVAAGGEIATEAAKPGGAVRELTSGVGDTIGNLSDTIGDTLTSVTDKVNPKRLVSGAGGGASKAKSKATQNSGDGLAAKAATALAASGAAGLLGGGLYRASRRPRVLGVPIGRRKGLGRVAKQLGKAGAKSTTAARRLRTETKDLAR